MERTGLEREVGRLMKALEEWHPATRAHSERAAIFATRLARLAGWSGQAIGDLHRAALLHDVGKLRVPVAILDKPGPLDHNELQVMRRHVWFSATLTRRIVTQEQALWIAGHHERPDGLGYPLRIGAAAIAEGSALLALADAWDVMTHARPYSRPLCEDEALAECTSLAGRQFTLPAVQTLHALLALDSVEVAA